MDLRRISAPALWGSRLAAIGLLALPVAIVVKRLNFRLLHWMQSDVSTYLLHEERLYSLSGGFLILYFTILGLIYFSLVELLAWALRKYGANL